MKQIKNSIRVNPNRPPNRRRVRMITNRVHQPSPLRRLHFLPRPILVLDIAARHGCFRWLTRIILLATGSIGRDTTGTPARPLRSRPGTFSTTVGGHRSRICGRRCRRRRRLFLELLLPGRRHAGAGGLFAAIFPGRVAR